jgi:acetylornithine deacetylase
MRHPLRDRAMLVLGDLVGFPTVTSESNLDLIDYAAGVLGAVGADLRFTRDETGLKANLLATIGPPAGGGVVLSGHSDVVPADDSQWIGSPFVAMRRDQRIYGRGTSDMKGFLACLLAMAPRFAEADLRRPAHLAITFDEEVGCRGAPTLVADLLDSGKAPRAAIVGEPTSMEIVVAHKGMHEYTTYITGLEGHGSRPAAAVNAVQFGSRFVTELMALAAELEEHAGGTGPFDPPESTINVGSMHGGVAHNVVAGECVIEWEMRPVSRADTTFAQQRIEACERRLEAEMRAISPDAAIATVSVGAADGLEYEPASPALELVRDLLPEAPTRTAAFSTEAGIYQAAGIPAVVCGPGSIDVAHQPDEWIGLDQVDACLTFLDGLVGVLAD